MPLAAITPILSALKNPWVLLLIACGIGAAGTGWYRMQWLSVVEGQEQAIADAQKKADDLSNQLIVAQKVAEEATAKTVTVYRDRIVNAPQTSTCGPSVGAAADGVRALLRGPEAK
jgi:hypothetical protein